MDIRSAELEPGMFLLATLIMENLLDQETLEELEEELRPDVLPQGIGQAWVSKISMLNIAILISRLSYGRIILRIRNISNPKQGERIHSIFKILISARRTLKIYELQGALTIKAEDQSIDFEQRRIRDLKEYLQTKCGPIVKIAPSGDVELVHSSAKGYFPNFHSPATLTLGLL